jgi:hypothetical protein
MKAIFGIYSKHEDFSGALLYKLKRKHTTEAGDCLSRSAAHIKNTAANMYLSVAWDIKNSDNIFRVCLIECANDFTWNAAKLQALYRKYNSQIHSECRPSIVTWLMHDNTVMKTKLDVIYGSDYKLNLVLSKGARKGNMKRSIQIDPRRLVLLLSMLIVLIYTVSLSIEPLIKLNIHNRCSTINLMFPTYIPGYELERHRAPSYKVYAGDRMRSSFLFHHLHKSNGTLIYKLQRKQSYKSTEIDEDILSATHLLVVWKVYESTRLYADVLLVEDKGLDWNKYDLAILYQKYIDQFKLHSGSATKTWSLDDNIALMTALEIKNRDHMLNITISEVERYNNARTPAYIDSRG